MYSYAPTLPGLLRLVFLDGSLQIAVLLAREQTKLVEDRQVLFGLGEIAGQQVGLADVFVGAAVFGVEGQRPLVVLEGRIQVAP